MSCQNVLEKCRDISATQTRRDIFWQKNEISTYRRFQLRLNGPTLTPPGMTWVCRRRDEVSTLKNVLSSLPPPSAAMVQRPGLVILGQPTRLPHHNAVRGKTFSESMDLLKGSGDKWQLGNHDNYR